MCRNNAQDQAKVKARSPNVSRHDASQFSIFGARLVLRLQRKIPFAEPSKNVYGLFMICIGDSPFQATTGL
jgi:hypothetical protein